MIKLTTTSASESEEGWRDCADVTNLSLFRKCLIAHNDFTRGSHCFVENTEASGVVYENDAITGVALVKGTVDSAIPSYALDFAIPKFFCQCFDLNHVQMSSMDTRTWL